MDYKERREKLQLELSQLQALRERMVREMNQLDVQMVQMSGKINLLSELEGSPESQDAVKPQEVEIKE